MFTAYVIGALAVVAFVVRSTDEPQSAYRLSIETMLPSAVSVRPEDVTCPVDRGPSPIQFESASALADILPLYDGDLIAVRFSVSPRTGPLPEAVGFDVQWPADVVSSEGPICAFLIDNGSSPAALTWERRANGARFDVTNPPLGARTTIEAWLVADDPGNRATFVSAVTPDIVRDQDVIDPLGGRRTVNRRASGVPTVAVEAEARDDVPGYDVNVTITNQDPTTRALDVGLDLTTSSPVRWDLPDDIADRCSDGETMSCEVGDLADGDTVSFSLAAIPGAAFSARTLTCQGPPASSGYGVCVEATAVADGNVQTTASSLVEVGRPTDEAILISVEPDPVVVAIGKPIDVVFAVSSNSADDLGSVRIVGSDCTSIAKIDQPLDDGDGFLDEGETWRYTCSLAVPASGTFRFDVSAIDPSGSDVTASYAGAAEIIEPELTIVQVDLGDTRRFEVVNTGVGQLFDLALVVPGCPVLTLVDGDVQLSDEGDRVVYTCTGGVPTAAAIAYATTINGSQIASGE